MSKYHPQVYNDAQSLLKALEISHEKKRARRTLRRRICEIIRSHSGDEFDVEDICMRQYAEDVEIAPIELMIVDKSNPQGLPPGNFRSLPDVYYPSRVAALLQDHGFDGIIESPDAQRRDGDISGNWKRGDPPPRIENTAFRWPRYSRTSKPEIIYPAVLVATTPESFRLSLPCPTIRHTIDLLHSYGRRNPFPRQMICLLYIWMRSWDINEISPVTLSLLVIRFFQEEEVSRLTDLGRSTSVSAEHAQASVHYTATAWMPFDVREGPNRSILLNISYALFPPSQPTRDFSVVLSRFLRWIVSQKFHHRREDDKWPVLRINRTDISSGTFAEEIRTFDVTRLPWSHHQLIVPDPFVPTHNHAFNVHRSTLHYLSVLSESCGSLLRTTRPLHTIFGPYYRPEKIVEQRIRSGLPSPIRLQIPGISVGIRMERRQYFTSTTLREELMKLNTETSAGQHVRERRQRTIAKVERSIQSQFGQEFRIGAFGSTQYGVDGRNSDLDLVVIDPDRMTGFSPDVDLNSLPRIYKISEVSNALQHSGFRILQRIPKATVPIVKFKDPYTDIQCDLNINDQLGTINTSLIRDYCDILPILRPLLLAIKRWARPLGYNNPAGAAGKQVTFSSYTLTIMTIGLLQTRGTLPNLQEGTELSEGRTFWIRTNTQGRILCNARWKNVQDWTPPGEVEVEQALEDWFQYWGHEHDYRNNLISVRCGGVVPRRLPCDRKESENLRDGPFSGFRSPSSTTAGNNAAEKSPMKGERIKQDALPEANAEVLERHDSGDNQAPETVGNSPDGPSLTGANKGEDAEGEEFEAWSETEQDRTLVADEDGVGEDVFDVAPEAGEEAAQPFRWQSDVLCVADPFIEGKNLTGPIKPNVVIRFREDCQRVVMRLRMGGNLDSLLFFDPRTRPPSPTPQQRARRGQQPQRGQEGRRGERGRGTNRVL